MNQAIPPDHELVDGDGDLDAPFDAALRAAFGPMSTAAPKAGCGVLERLRESSGVLSRLLLQDEPDAPAPVVGTGENGLAVQGRGRYQVLGEIARGGMGIVLKGRDPDLGRDVAMKVLHPGLAVDPTSVRRFVEEAQIGGQLQHPGILPVYELGLDREQRPFFTMRLVKGRTLAALLEERPNVSHDLGRFLAIFEQVCQTVAYAHARGVVHRDLKPSNIMVGVFGEVQVVDWGLSKVLRQGNDRSDAPGECGDGDVDEPHVTTVRTTDGALRSQPGAILGTPAYMSPEQAQGDVKTVDEQTDVFALGAILCEILTGQPPYLGTRLEILEDAAAGNLEAAFARLDAVTSEAEMVQLAKRSLDPARSIRPRHAGVLAREVAAYLASLGDRVRAAEVAAAEARTVAVIERSRRRTTALALALSVAILAGVGLAMYAERERRAHAENSIATVAALLRKGDWFRNEARRVPPDQLETWERALAQVRRTAEIVGAGAIDAAAKADVARLLDQLTKEEASLHQRVQQLRLERND